MMGISKPTLYAYVHAANRVGDDPGAKSPSRYSAAKPYQPHSLSLTNVDQGQELMSASIMRMTIGHGTFCYMERMSCCS